MHYSKTLPLHVQYAGDWYQTWETPVAFVAEGNTCTRAQYGSFEQGVNNVSVYNIGSDADGSISDICGWAQPVDPLSPTGELEVHFFSGSGPYLVLETDYENYVSGYSCTNHTLGFHDQTAWILTREQNPSQDIVSQKPLSIQPHIFVKKLLFKVDKAFDVFERNNLIFNDWYSVPQSDECVYDISPSCKDRWP